MKIRKLNLIAKKVCAWYSSFSLKGFLRLTKKDLDNGKNFEQQDNRGLPMNIYIQRPQERGGFWHVLYLTNRMQYAEIEVYGSQSQAKRAVDKILDKYQRIFESREKRKNERAEQRKNFRHSFQVGDILYSSWGYDQTNIDFYLVKQVGEKSIKIVEIGQKVVKSDPPYDYVVPYPQKEIGRPMTKVVSTNNSVRISSYAAAWKWDGKPKGQTDVYHGH